MLMRRRDRRSAFPKHAETGSFGLIVIAVALCSFLVWNVAARICNGWNPGRYCSAEQTWEWLVDAGGWWKLLALGTGFALCVWIACGFWKFCERD